MYNDYSTYIRKIFGSRVQKISIDAGFTCPNIDGTLSSGGCIYCDNRTFNPYYCSSDKDITQQLEEGIGFFSPKYKTQKYLAYFQSHTNTYGSVNEIIKKYKLALDHPGVIGLVISTRPDCIDGEKLDAIKQIIGDRYLSIEYGVESTDNETLKKINRWHTFEDSVSAIELTASKNINVCAHMILGLPFEDKDKMLTHAKRISNLPLTSVKLHQLQIIKNTTAAVLYKTDPDSFVFFTPSEYVDFVIDFLELLNPAFIIERFISESPVGMIEGPSWKGLKNFEIVEMIKKRMRERNTWQGRQFASFN